MNIIFNNINSRYDAINHFMAKLMDAFSKQGIQVSMHTAITDELIREQTEPIDAIISMNASCADTFRNGSFTNPTNIPIYGFLVDHPYMHDIRINAIKENLHLFCVDHNHVQYVKQFYPHVKSCHMVPHGGSIGNNIKPFEERAIPIFFSGSYRSSEDQLKQVMTQMAQEDADIQQILQIAIELMKQHFCPLEDALQAILQASGNSSELIPIICSAYTSIDIYIRSYYRDMILSKIAKQGYELHIYGFGWEDFSCSSLQNVHIHPSTDYESILDIMGDSKIVLNVMPWFKNGSHERILNAMLNGAICLTDTSKWITDHFVPYSDIAVYSLSNTDEMLNIIDNLLHDDAMAKYITENARKKAETEHQWEARAKEILTLLQ